MPPRRKSVARTPQLGSLGNAVEAMRKKLGISQEELAERMETDLTQIGGIERGVRNPSYETLYRLSRALETRVGEIASLADRLEDQHRNG